MGFRHVSSQACRNVLAKAKPKENKNLWRDGPSPLWRMLGQRPHNFESRDTTVFPEFLKASQTPLRKISKFPNRVKEMNKNKNTNAAPDSDSSQPASSSEFYFHF